ncbi:DUF6538 domain-containing protein [Asticcacaulis taihuensis]|uniref:DUF6538 domain-containing protein n=1 Tax=Asticcacaulis taihuensis TaxID=260084 RepID=UPI003F7C8A6B
MVSDAMPRLGHDRRRSSARMVLAHNLQNDRLNASGLMIRGSTFYARWMIPRPLQAILGRSHFVKSLRTKNAHDARRLIRAAGWEYEELLRQAEGHASKPPLSPPVAPTQTQTQAPLSPSPRPKAKSKTFEQVFELFINDPTRKRAKKTVAGYKDGIEIIYAVIGRQTPVADIDREVCRRLLETLQ